MSIKTNTISFIRRHFSSLPSGQMVVTKELLIHGSRANVDKALQNLVKAKFIRRLARGVFARYVGVPQWPTVREIAEVKAKAFGRQVRVHGHDTAARHNLGRPANDAPTYLIDGASSSFAFFGGRIFFKKASKKKMAMPDTGAGLAIRALWSIGRENLDRTHIQRISHLWHSRREEKERILYSKAWMPAWLGDLFLVDRYLGPSLQNPAYCVFSP